MSVGGHHTALWAEPSGNMFQLFATTRSPVVVYNMYLKVKSKPQSCLCISVHK